MMIDYRKFAALGPVLLVAAIAHAQTPIQTSGGHAPTGVVQLQSPTLLKSHDIYMGSITTAPASSQTVQLSLDDAIRRGLEYNTGLIQQQQTEKEFEAQVLGAESALIPSIKLDASTGVNEYNLIAFGFKPKYVSLIAPGYAFNPFIKVDVTSADAELNTTLVSIQAIDLYRAAKSATSAQKYEILSAHGNVIYNVANAYLTVLADQANVANVKAQLDSSDRFLQQSKDRDQAGTATRLDVLRANVQQQNDAQSLEQAQNNLAKDLIALNRLVGLAPSQKIELTDNAPYAELADRPLDELKAQAFRSRKDYLALLAALRGYQLQTRAVRAERLPVLSFDGNYGVTGETHVFYHGTMYAAGKLEIPLFKEAELRGDREVADAQLAQVRNQLASVHEDIDAQIRSSLLDVQSAQKIVKVAESNRDLAKEELDQSEQRYHAGVDDNLPLIRAQAAVAAANAQWVSSLFQFNMAKLGLARNVGVLESQFKQYIGESAQQPSLAPSPTR